MKFMITALLLAAVSAQVIEPDRNCCKFYPEDNYHPSNEPTQVCVGMELHWTESHTFNSWQCAPGTGFQHCGNQRAGPGLRTPQAGTGFEVSNATQIEAASDDLYFTAFWGHDCTHSVGYISTPRSSSLELPQADMQRYNIIPNGVGSVVLSEDFQVILYDYDGFRGNNKIIRGDGHNNCIPLEGFPVSSIQINKQYDDEPAQGQWMKAYAYNYPITGYEASVFFEDKDRELDSNGVKGQIDASLSEGARIQSEGEKGSAGDTVGFGITYQWRQEIENARTESEQQKMSMDCSGGLQGENKYAIWQFVISSGYENQHRYQTQMFYCKAGPDAWTEPPCYPGTCSSDPACTNCDLPSVTAEALSPPVAFLE